MNKLVERKACVDNVWIKSANYTKVQVIQSVALAEVHMKWREILTFLLGSECDLNHLEEKPQRITTGNPSSSCEIEILRKIFLIPHLTLTVHRLLPDRLLCCIEAILASFHFEVYHYSQEYVCCSLHSAFAIMKPSKRGRPTRMKSRHILWLIRSILVSRIWHESENPGS